MLSAARIIELLQLELLAVEGGYFRETYRADDIMPAAALPPRYHQSKVFCGAIYYLLHGDNFSALHRLLTDEVYHFYLGDPVELLLLYPDGKSEVVTLGTDLEAGERVQFVSPCGVWQGSQLKPGGAFALLGTTMAPAYDAGDFELGAREEMVRLYPQCTELIRRLTRAHF